MKRILSLVVALAFTAGIAFAQVPPPGNSEATIDQANANNTATVTQFNALLQPTNKNVADVDQTGAGNTTTITQNHNGNLDPVVAQNGVIFADVDQSGNANTATIMQGPDAAAQMGQAKAIIDQNGHTNEATIHQVKYLNDAEIIQNGDNNKAVQEQDINLVAVDLGSANTADLTQNGDWNLSDQQQDGWANTVSAIQDGDYNTLGQYQLNYSFKSTAAAYQGGDYSKVLQTQTGYLNYASAVQGPSSVSNNHAEQVQESGADRSGSDYTPINSASILQTNGSNNYGFQSQKSVGGDVLMNLAILSQGGSDNWSSQTQDGLDLQSTVLQFGGNNVSTVNQTGTGHTATVTQTNPDFP
jgi:hypothetical protein